jgi:hypothetical protein
LFFSLTSTSLSCSSADHEGCDADPYLAVLPIRLVLLLTPFLRTSSCQGQDPPKVGGDWTLWSSSTPANIFTSTRWLCFSSFIFLNWTSDNAGHGNPASHTPQITAAMVCNPVPVSIFNNMMIFSKEAVYESIYDYNHIPTLFFSLILCTISTLNLLILELRDDANRLIVIYNHMKVSCSWIQQVQDLAYGTGDLAFHLLAPSLRDDSLRLFMILHDYNQSPTLFFLWLVALSQDHSIYLTLCLKLTSW